ncbi:MAG: hypothetical protein ACC657_00750 [Thiohalomonadales bacterium]
MPLKLTKMRFINTVLIASTLVLISCGGGDNTPAATTPGVPELSTAVISNQALVLDSTTSPKTAREIINLFSNVGDIPTTPGTVKITAADISNPASRQSITKITKNLFTVIQNNNVNGISVIRATLSCTNGGTRTIPDNIPTALPVNLNGTYTVSFNNCKEGTATINGSITFTGSLIVDNAGAATSINAQFTFNNFTISDIGSNDSINGDFTIVMGTVAGVSTFSFSGTSLSLRDELGATDIKNFNVTYTSNINIETFDINFTISSTFIDGVITVATPIQFETTIGKEYPYQGQMMVTGANNANFRLTVNTPSAGGGIATDTVTLDIDADGVNGYETSQTLMWSEL